MRKVLSGATVVLALLLFSGKVLAANMTNSAHDLTIASTADPSADGLLATGTDRICVFCHTPHKATASGPLWNKAANATVYVEYDSGTLDNATATPGPGSLPCLACHDGSTSELDELNLLDGAPVTGDSWTWTDGGGVLTNSLLTAVSTAYMGTNLSSSHPVGVDVTADSNIETPANITGVAPELPLYGAGSNIVECGTCHNPHGNTGFNYFLRADTAASALCLECHIDK